MLNKFLICFVLVSTCVQVAEAQTVTTLLKSGSSGDKKNLVIIGDGFQAGADQTTFNNYVNTTFIQNLFGEGPLREDMNAFNIYRINTISTDSGVTQVDAMGNVVIARNTALDYRYSGVWARCWMEYGPTTGTKLNAILDSLVPERDYVFIVLNTPGFGGCGGGGQLTITLGVDWTVLAHEAGHAIGNLCDEYIYPMAAPSGVTVTPSSGGALAAGTYFFQIVAIASDGSGATAGSSEVSCTVDGVTTKRCSLSWTADPKASSYRIYKGTSAGGQDRFQTSATNSFNYDTDTGATLGTLPPANATGPYIGGEPGCADLTKTITPLSALKWKDFVDPTTPLPTPTTPLPTGLDPCEDAGAFQGGDGGGSGIWRPGFNCRMNSNSPPYGPVGYNRMKEVLDDKHDYTYLESYAGDFDGDGKDDVVIHNSNSLAFYHSKGANLEVAWIATGKIPCWDDFKPGDQFYVGDFNGDGKDDLFVFNYKDWVIPYFALLRSTGAGFECIRRFDQQLPGWDDMKPNDRFYVADFDGDGKDDIYVFNGKDWAVGYLEMLRSTGTDLVYVKRFDDTLPGWDRMKPNDEFFVADFGSTATAQETFSCKLKEHSGANFAQFIRTKDIVTSQPLSGAMNFSFTPSVLISDLTITGAPITIDGVPRGEPVFTLDSSQTVVGSFDAATREIRVPLNLLLNFPGGPPGSPTIMIPSEFQGRVSSANDILSGRIIGRTKAGTPVLGEASLIMPVYSVCQKAVPTDSKGDGKEDLYIFNARDWSIGYFQMLRSTGSDLEYVIRYDEELPGWDDIKPNDKFYVADFDGDGKKDLYVFNGKDWAIEYLEMLRSEGNSLSNTQRFDGTVPGWDGLASNDQFFVADIDGNKKDDLYAYNARDWATEYLGVLISTGTNLAGSWQEDAIGNWDFGPNDLFLVANFNGGANWDDLFVRDKDRFGLLLSLSGSVSQVAFHPKWIHDHRFHRLGWW